MKSYASVADLRDRLGISGTAKDDELALALVAATRWVDVMTDGDATADDVWTGDAADIVVDTAATAAIVQLVIGLGVRIYKGPDVPFGIAGMSDNGLVAYVRRVYPEAELLLVGQRSTWGLA